MAFQHPSLASDSRPNTAPAAVVEQSSAFISSSRQQALDDSHEWVLFPSTQSYSHTVDTDRASTDQTLRTSVLSRLSDLESLNAGTHSERQADTIHEPNNRLPGVQEEEADKDLDSLDEGLHDFQTPEPSRLLSEYFHPSSSILPRHDGLGMFPSSAPLNTSLTKRSHGNERRPSNVEKNTHDEANEVGMFNTTLIDSERRERIEQWRLEHSRVILDEIEKETRNYSAPSPGRHSNSSRKTQDPVHVDSFKRSIAPDSLETSKSVEDERALKRIISEHSTTTDYESIWQRITRRVMQDFMGLNDEMLAIIFGETLASSTDTSKDDLPPAAKAPRLDDSATRPSSSTEETWEKRLVERLSRELGFLVQHISDYPGAFSTATHILPAASEYAGIPITKPTSSRNQPRQPQRLARPSTNSTRVDGSFLPDPPSFVFQPTIQGAHHHSSAMDASSFAALWGIEEEETSGSPQRSGDDLDLDYWESAPDLKTIFQRFIFTRFNRSSTNNSHAKSTRRMSSSNHPSHSSPQIRRNLTPTSTSPESRRRAAIIRQYHPLISKYHQDHHHRRRSWLRTNAASGSSCASESLRRRGGSIRTAISGADGGIDGGSNSIATSMSTSRNYWDLGGSHGGGGSGWGEV